MKYKYLLLGSIIAVCLSILIVAQNATDQPSAKTTPAKQNQPAEQPSDTNHTSAIAKVNTSITNRALIEERLNDQQIAALIEKHVTPQMRQDINNMLNPSDEKYKEVHTANGGYIELGKRAVSVPIAIIDDNGNTLVTDITQPLAE